MYFHYDVTKRTEKTLSIINRTIESLTFSKEMHLALEKIREESGKGDKDPNIAIIDKQIGKLQALPLRIDVIAKDAERQYVCIGDSEKALAYLDKQLAFFVRLVGFIENHP